MTAEQIANLATQGRYWWKTAAGEFYATQDKTPTTAGDVYLLDADPVWLAQWDGDWQAASDQINEALSRQQQEG